MNAGSTVAALPPRTAAKVLHRQRQSRRFLLRRLPKGSRGAEVGVWRRDFSAALLRSVKPVELHLIDPWRYEGGQAECRGSLYAGPRWTQADMDAVHDRRA